ncbi:uncharacterized protein LOC141729058 [Zonotrichia albicollis]|uniref:uncharacterized protein LOC141729058 n=1 Tax=Zonotrichia albicollis TaxID=44394 RepID=UPI003D811733
MVLPQTTNLDKTYGGWCLELGGKRRKGGVKGQGVEEKLDERVLQLLRWYPLGTRGSGHAGISPPPSYQVKRTLRPPGLRVLYKNRWLGFRLQLLVTRSGTSDNSHVQLLSIQLFGKLMELVVEEGDNALTTVVSQSLLPLFLHWHHENLHVAEACGEALLGAARFLRRRDLEELLRQKRRMKFVESLLLQDESRAAEHLRWALPHLQSPQRPLREAAVRFIGVAGVLMMGQKEELQVLTEALRALREDESPSCMNTWIQMKFQGRSAELRLSPGADVPVPASFDVFQFPSKMGPPAEQKGPAAAPGTALVAHS